MFCRGGCSEFVGICADVACEECDCPDPLCGDYILDPGEDFNESTVNGADVNGDGYLNLGNGDGYLNLGDGDGILNITPGADVESKAKIVPLDGYQLASRLSYLLWSTMPDAELLKLAAKDQLKQPAELRQQVEHAGGLRAASD